LKILVTRTDRLGDLVLSLPAIDLLAAAHPDWEIHVMTAPATAPLMTAHPGVTRVWTWRDDLPAASVRALAGELRSEEFDAAVMLQYRRELASLLRRVGIARRHGPHSRLSSWFLLNHGVRQSRSARDEHEAVYNCELAARLADVRDADCALPRLHPGADARAVGRAFRAERAADARTVAFVHPGSGGSALDWEPARFATLANDLATREGWRVFVTGAGADSEAVGAVSAGLDPAVDVLLDAFGLRDFAGVLAAGDVFVGPSTGPLHMAAALDLATIGLYPPVRTMSPRRWGPRGRWCRVLVPEVMCPENRFCAGERCAHHNCMYLVAAETVSDATVILARERRMGLADDEPVPEKESLS